MTINVNCPPRGLFIGRETENVARTLDVDFSAWAAEHGPGTLQVLIQRPGDSAPYPVTITVEGTVATWKPSETDLAEAGTGAVQLVYTTAAGVREKTQIIPVMVEPSLGVETDPPDGWTSWIDQLTDLAAVTEQHAASAAESAENAGDSATDAQRYATDAGDAKNAAVAAAEAAAASASHYPQIVNGVWYVWSPSAGAYISTGIDAQGEDGVSPTVEITAIQGGHRVVITDAEGSHTFDVMDGVTPDMSAYRTAAEQDVIDDAQDEELNNLKSALNTKAGILRDTVIGSVASFVPDSTVPNLLGLSVALEPIQDLHGYDSPWPAGGGKNLFNPAEAVDGVFISNDTGEEREQTGSTATGFIPVTAGLFYRMSPTLNSGNWGAFYDANKVFISGFSGYGGAKTAPTGAAYLRCTINRDNNNPDWATNFQVEQNTEATSYSPYSNICPISGRDSVEVYDDPAYGGEIEWNQLVENGNFESLNNWYGYNATLSIDGNEIAATSPIGQGYFGFRQRAGSSVRSGHIYLLSIEGKASVENYRVYNPYYASSVLTDRANGSNTILIGKSWTSLTAIVRATSDDNALFGIRKGADGADDEERTIYGRNACIFDLTQMFGQTEAERIFALERASDGAGVAYFHNLFPHDYYPYNEGETNCVSAVNGDPYRHETISLPETVYGGDVGVVSGSGESLPYYASYNGEPLVGPWISSMDAYAPGATPTVGAQVVDMGGTPTPISTTPTEISTVEGQNNVFSPDGDVTVEYAADLKTYIDSKIAAAVAAMS